MKTSRSGLAALFFIYFVWGSSFLAIRIAVNGAGSFAPYTLAALRTLSAGLVLLACGLAQGNSPRMSAPAFLWLALTGTLLWVGGHALVIWAERRIDSGLAALIFASIPLWAALLEGVRGKGVRVLPVLVGFVGVALVLPLGGSLGNGLWLDGAVLLFSAFLWSLGTVLGDGPAKGVPIAVATGTQLTVAGLINGAWALLAREGAPAPGSVAIAACVYLSLVGTVAAFLAYVYAQRELPLRWVMSFAYVNPVVAVILGALVLGETLTTRTFAGMAVVIGSVFWLFASKTEERT